MDRIKSYRYNNSYWYKYIPFSLNFNYKFIIYPQYWKIYADNVLTFVTCVEWAVYMPDTSLWISEDEIPAHYLDTLLDYWTKLL